MPGLTAAPAAFVFFWVLIFGWIRYRVADNVNLPLRIIPAVHEEGRARVNINLKVSADFSYKLFGSNIVVKVRTFMYVTTRKAFFFWCVRPPHRDAQECACGFAQRGGEGRKGLAAVATLVYHGTLYGRQGSAAWVKHANRCACELSFQSCQCFDESRCTNASAGARLTFEG